MIRKTIFVGPLGVAENVEQSIRIGLFYAALGCLQRVASIHGFFTNLVPVTTFRHLETVIFRKRGIFNIAARFCQGGLKFLIIRITDALEEEQQKDIGFKIGGIHRATKNIRCGPKPIGRGVRVGAVFLFIDCAMCPMKSDNDKNTR